MLNTRILTKLTSQSYKSPIISQLYFACKICTQDIQQRQQKQQWRLYGDSYRNLQTIGFQLSHAVPQWHHQKLQSYCTGVVNEQGKQQTVEQQSLLKRVLNKVGLQPNMKTRLRVASHLLYESVADKINYLTFFNDFNLPNTFNSWFLVTELHVWMLLARVMAEGSESGEDGRFLRNSIVEAMWGDVNTRAKKLGAHSPSRTRKQIEILSEQFQAALIAYDEGIMSDDRVLAASLWRRFFEMNCDDYQKIERLVKYVRQQMVMLDGLSREQLLYKPKIPWIDLSHIRD